MKFKDFLKEEMPTLPRKFRKEFEELGAKHEYQKKNVNIFPKGVDTIYIPVKGSHTTSLETNLSNTINNAIQNEKYNIEGSPWRTWETKNEKVTKENIDYKNGIVTFTIKDKSSEKPNRTQEFNIEDLIKKYGKRGWKKIYVDMWKASAFRRGPTFDNLELAISRSPEQVGAMSTNTGWKSCMNLHKGVCRQYTRKDVEYGTVVVYLIDAADKKIQYPIGRVLMKPFININGERILKIGEATYGDFPEIAKKTLKKWLDNLQKTVKPGAYRRPSELYGDRESDWYSIGKKQRFSVGDVIQLTNLNDEDKRNYNSVLNKKGRIIGKSVPRNTYDILWDGNLRFYEIPGEILKRVVRK